MRNSRTLAGWAAGWGGWIVWLWALPVLAQQMTIGAPFHTVREGFFEHIGTQWSLQGRNWFVQFGGADLAQPAFGGFQPGAGIQGGFGFGGPGWSGQFQFSAAQGNTRTLTSTTPSVTMMNGATAYVADVSLSPFVIGVIPVVGAGGMSPWVGTMPGVRVAGPLGPAWAPVPGSSRVQRFLAEGGLERLEKGGFLASGVGWSAEKASAKTDLKVEEAGGGSPSRSDALVLEGRMGAGVSGSARGPAQLDPSVQRLAGAQQSTAGQAVMSVAEAQALRQTESEQAAQEALQWYQRGREAEKAGNPKVAAIYYQMAARRAVGPLQQEILARLKTLQSSPSLR